MGQKQVLCALGQPKQMKQPKHMRTTRQSIMSGLKSQGLFTLFKGKNENFAVTSDLILLYAMGEVGVPTAVYTALPHAESDLPANRRIIAASLL